ncbi:MAG TPA: aspartate dehydrogenase [Methylomirabilota bacterium]|nr:aspartate dehydrogenase [Methylomirabilota bacterium]
MTGRDLRIGMVGLGAIGRAVSRALADGLRGCYLAGATSRDEARGKAFLESLPGAPPYFSLPRLVEESDLVVEAASQAALAELAPLVLEAGRDLLVLSVGGLLDHPEWPALAAARGARIHAPSAAIAGLDGLKGAAVAGHLASVVMETRKPPGGLVGAPGVAHVDLDGLTAETLVFEGPAREACRAFPANVNVVAAVSLAGLGPDATRIRVYAVPGLGRNRHTVMAEGAFGRLRVEIENVPSENPRTGKLSYLSTIAYLGALGSPLRIGT